jgi:hypothetical protein
MKWACVPNYWPEPAFEQISESVWEWLAAQVAFKRHLPEGITDQELDRRWRPTKQMLAEALFGSHSSTIEPAEQAMLERMMVAIRHQPKELEFLASDASWKPEDKNDVMILGQGPPSKMTIPDREAIERSRLREIQERYDHTYSQSGRGIAPRIMDNPRGIIVAHEDENAPDSLERMMQKAAQIAHADYLGRATFPNTFDVFRFSFGFLAHLDIYLYKDHLGVSIHEAKKKGEVIYNLAISIAQQFGLPLHSGPFALISKGAKLRWAKLVEQKRAFFDDKSQRFIAPVIHFENTEQLHAAA